MSAKINPNPSSSNSEVSRPRDASLDQSQRYGASAYIDQSEYDVYKQPTIKSTPGGTRAGAYSNHPTDNKNRYVQDVIDDDVDDDSIATVANEHSTGQQQYTKHSSTTSHAGLWKDVFVQFCIRDLLVLQGSSADRIVTLVRKHEE